MALTRRMAAAISSANSGNQRTIGSFSASLDVFLRLFDLGQVQPLRLLILLLDK